MGEIRLAKDSGFFCCEVTEELGLGLPQPQSNGGEAQSMDNSPLLKSGEGLLDCFLYRFKSHEKAMCQQRHERQEATSF